MQDFTSHNFAALISILLLQSMTRTVPTGCNLRQNANEGCNSCASLAGLVLSFIAAAFCSYNNFKF